LNLEWLDYPSRIVHAASLIVVALMVAYMVVRDRQFVPRAIRTTQGWFVLYIAWHAGILILAPLVDVKMRVVLRVAGALIALVFSISIILHVRRMKSMLRHVKSIPGVEVEHDGGG